MEVTNDRTESATAEEAARNEEIVVDVRATFNSTELIEQKLLRLARAGALPVSCLHTMRRTGRDRP